MGFRDLKPTFACHQALSFEDSYAIEVCARELRCSLPDRSYLSITATSLSMDIGTSMPPGISGLSANTILPDMDCFTEPS